MTARLSHLVRLVPGIVLLGALACLIKYAIAPHLPTGIDVVAAILLGVLVGNALHLPDWLADGVRTYEFWLKTGIVFLGSRILLDKLLALGSVGLTMIAVEILISLAVVIIFTRFFNISDKLCTLLATGVAICGVSAIMACAGAIRAKERDTAYAIATILIFGLGAILVYAFIGEALDMDARAFGTWAGLAVDNTAEVVATAELYDQRLTDRGINPGELSVKDYAILVKNGRNALMGIIVLAFAVYYARKGLADQVEHKALFVWNHFPKFVIGFILFSVLATAGFFDKPQLTALKNLSKWCFLLTFVGVGYATQIKDMKQVGLMPFIVGITLEATVAAITLAMVFVLYGSA